MFKAKLCKCNNCGNILIDENPQIGAEELDVPDKALYMVTHAIGYGFFWVCPICLTDEYLTDLPQE